MKAIFERELNAYFNGVQGYLCCAFILLFAGIYTMVINLNSGYVNFEYVVDSMDFILLIVIPILTMRVISEERRQKTDRLLYSLPVSMTKIVIGKYLAMLVVLALPTVIMCIYPYILSFYGAVPFKTVYSSISAFFMLSSALAAIGMFISSTTENQGIAAGICFICMLVIYFSSSLAGYIPDTPLASFGAAAAVILAAGIILNALIKNLTVSFFATLVFEGILILIYFINSSIFEGLFPRIMEEISVFDRFYTFTYGVFDIGSVVYFISVIAVFLFMTVQSLEKRRWN